MAFFISKKIKSNLATILLLLLRYSSQLMLDKGYLAVVFESAVFKWFFNWDY